MLYDTLTLKEFIKAFFSFEDAKRIIISESGKHFDPDVVNAFIKFQSGLIPLRLRRGITGSLGLPYLFAIKNRTKDNKDEDIIADC
ncbi:MAG: hypothetical protein NTX05_04160 [Fusobacteria bacterium]|nr:hypothetical protein [Fusobacteriota bacterium]